MALTPLPGGQAYSETPDDLPPDDLEPLLVHIDDEDNPPEVDPSSGAILIEVSDGGVAINLGGAAAKDDEGKNDHNANLVDYIDPMTLGGIASELSSGIANDDMTRQEWLENRAKGIDMLGFKMEGPRDDAGSSTAPVEGMSSVRHTLLTEAVVRFQAAAAAELLPAEGPVKVRNDNPPNASVAPGLGHNGGPPLNDAAPSGIAMAAQLSGVAPQGEGPDQQPVYDYDVLAAALEQDMNHYLTVTDRGYRPDFERMLFWCGFGGSGFRKVYYDPVRRMPLCRTVDASDLIVSNAANELEDAVRVTHKILMSKPMLVRMQIAGVYTDVPGVTSGALDQNIIGDKIAETQGFQIQQMRPEDMPYTLYECYCSLDIKGFEHKDKAGKITGLPLPYRVTIEKDSQRILEVRRNWREDDPMCLPKQSFVRYTFIDAMGIYGVGLLNLLGNANKALTAAWRLMLDSGMFANFPGFLYSKSAGRQKSNEFRVPPGGGVEIETGGQPIGTIVMPLPYKDNTMGLQSLAKAIEDDGQRLGGTAELQIGEGRQDAPVGTTLALIEQATKILAAVHIHLHAAQSQEFQMLKELFIEYPESLWANCRRPAKSWEIDEFLEAINNCDIVPAADPNTPSRMHRIMKAQAILLLSQAAPQLYNPRSVHQHLLRVLGGPDPNLIMNTPQEEQQFLANQAAAGKDGKATPPQDPSKMAALQAKAQETQQEAALRAAEMQNQTQSETRQDAAKWAQMQQESADRASDRQSREKVAQMREETQRIKNIGEIQREHLQAFAAEQANRPHIVNVPSEGGGEPSANEGMPIP